MEDLEKTVVMPSIKKELKEEKEQSDKMAAAEQKLEKSMFCGSLCQYK